MNQGELHLSRMAETTSLDGLLEEAKTTESFSAMPNISDVSERESSTSPSKDILPDASAKVTGTGAARFPCATDAGQKKTAGESGLAELTHKVDQLTSLLSNVTPVVQQLKAAYDAARDDEDKLLNSDEDEDSAADDKATEPPPKKGKSDDSKASSSSCAQITELVKEVTEDEQTAPPLHEKVSSLVDSLLASGLNEPALTKRKENIKRPENCKLLRVTKVNSEIWDIAQKQTRSMDARLQKVQESLVKGIIPLARLMGATGEVLGQEGQMPSPDDLWKGLSNSVLLIASATHDLNMCRRDLFKVDLDDTYKAICSSKQPVGLELFGDDLTERLKTVKESNKAAKQLTGHKRKRNEEYSRPSFSARGPFLFHRRGNQHQGFPRKRTNYQPRDNRSVNKGTKGNKGSQK